MAKVNVLIVGAGEYTTGLNRTSVVQSDKKIGVVGLVVFDLRRRGLVDRVLLADVDGKRWPVVRDHFQTNIAKVYHDLDVSFEEFPKGSQVNPKAYEDAISSLNRGDIVIIFTPDDTHFPIAASAASKGLHVLVAKPIVQTLKDHLQLLALQQKQQVLIAVEYHKRWDPCYRDAKYQIQGSAAKKGFGDFSFFQSFMSQPKSQLTTFQAWAGKSSDISYYLNSHHIDIHCWYMQLPNSSGELKLLAKPIKVIGVRSKGASEKIVGRDCEDTITLVVTWKNIASGNEGHALYTSSWISPKTDVHSQQYFFYQGHNGEIRVDQAHRGYFLSHDDSSYASVNPLYMKYTPDDASHFAGQNGYGYQSIEEFLQAALLVNQKKAKTEDFAQRLALASTTTLVTAILDAGRKSLDSGVPFKIVYRDEASCIPIDVQPYASL